MMSALMISGSNLIGDWKSDTKLSFSIMVEFGDGHLGKSLEVLRLSYEALET